MNRIRIIWLLIGVAVGVMASQGRIFHSSPDLAAMTATINSMAKEGARIDLSKHAWQRMGERNLTQDNIRTVLASGTIKQPPRMGEDGDLAYILEDKGAKVAVVPREDSLFIVTVMWGGT